MGKLLLMAWKLLWDCKLLVDDKLLKVEENY